MKNPHPLPPLEQAILQWLLLKHPELKEQIEQAQIKDYESSGVGFFIHFSLPDSVQPLIEIESPMEGPQIKSSELEHDAGSLLFFEKGRMNLLEIYSYGDTFNQNLTSFSLMESEVVKY